jgi:hypothetical protein
MLGNADPSVYAKGACVCDATNPSILANGTQFTCFTGTKVQILTLLLFRSMDSEESSDMSTPEDEAFDSD